MWTGLHRKLRVSLISGTCSGSTSATKRSTSASVSSTRRTSGVGWTAPESAWIAPIFSAQTGLSSIQVPWWPWSLDGMASQACTLWNQGVKVNSAYHCEHMLTQCYWPGILANLPATNERYHFYADNAPSHVSISTREFIRLNKPRTTRSCLRCHRAAGSQHVRLLLVEDHPRQRYGTRGELRADVLRQACNLPLDEIRRSICSWPQRLLKCHMAGGGHFEG